MNSNERSFKKEIWEEETYAIEASSDIPAQRVTTAL